MVAGDSSKDEDGWRVHERYCINHRAAFDMHDIVENIFIYATEFMHDSCLRMDEVYVGKPEDLYLWGDVAVIVGRHPRPSESAIPLVVSAI